MRKILPVVLLLLPPLSAGEYFELHRDAYEVVLTSNSFAQEEKQAFQTQYEILILKDKLLKNLEAYSKQKDNNDKVIAIEQLVDEISCKMKHMYLSYFDMRKNDNEDGFSPLCASLLSEFSFVEDMDFESYLCKIKQWHSGKIGKLYFEIMRHTTVYNLGGSQNRDVFIQRMLEDSLLRNEEKTDNFDDEIPEIEY